MKTRVAINGFGRIGRLFLRQAILRDDIDVVAINDLADVPNRAYLFEHDSTHGKFSGSVIADEGYLVINGKRIMCTSNKHPAECPWKDLNIDYVVECTGLFCDQAKASGHLFAGAKKVIIGAPAKDDTKTLVMGVNQQEYDPTFHNIVSMASCTTMCLAPIVKILLDNFGIEEGLMSTIHACTASQPTVDGMSKKDWRGGRGGFQNIIPSSTGAAKMVGLVLPQVKGKLTGMAYRVPVADVSVVDLTVKLSKPTSLVEIKAAMKKASEGEMKGILAYTEDAVVSSDFTSDTHSSTFDATACVELNSTFFKIVSWYDNEMGYATRLVDLVQYMDSKKE